MSVRRTMVAALAAVSLLGVGLVSSSAALAAEALEAPTIGAATGVTARTATLHGVLNPGTDKEASEYDFMYGPGTECYESGFAPEPAGTSAGEKQAETQEVTGLQPNTEYGFCLRTFNAVPELLLSPSLTFKTLAVKPEVGTQSASGVTPFDAVLEAVVNPNNDETTTNFEYATNEALTENLETVAGPTINGGEQPTSVDLGGKLAPSTTYYFRIVTSNSAGNADGTPVQSFATLPEEAPALSEENTTELTSTGVLVNGQVNPNYEETTYGAKCGTGTEPSEANLTYPGTEPLAAGFGNDAVSVKVTSLTPNTQYYCWLVASNKKGETVGATALPLKTQAEPSVVTGANSNVTRTTALLAGTVDPLGAFTQYHFVYGTTMSYGQSTPLVSVGSEFEEIAASASLEELHPGTTYHYALVATNTYGTVTGTDHTFTTSPLEPPSVATGGAVNVGHESAVITAGVEPDGLHTTYEFQLGTEAGVYSSQGYGSLDGSGAQGVSAELLYLAPGVTYHYRIVATNQDGTAYGADQTFTTASYANPLASVPVSPPVIVVSPEVTPVPKVTTPVKPKPKPKKHKKHKRKSKKKKKKK